MAVKFTRKLTGAKAHLLARIGFDYLEGNRDDMVKFLAFHIPLFTWLNEYHRVQLIQEVLVGLLCPDEPLPPNTIQHCAAFAFLAVWLSARIDMELETQVNSMTSNSIREDLIKHASDDSHHALNPYWKEIPEVHNYEMEVIRHRAERYKKKLNNRKTTSRAYSPPTKEESESCDDRKKTLDNLFGDRHYTPNDFQTPLSRKEKQCFWWRLLCYEALQEENEETFLFDAPYLPPLKCVTFDFRSVSHIQWYEAIDTLWYLCCGVITDHKDRWILGGIIDERKYADKEEHARIVLVNEHVDLLREVFRKTWSPSSILKSKLCIYTLCYDSDNIVEGDCYTGRYIGGEVAQFINFWFQELKMSKRIDWGKPILYQKRYQCFQDLAPLLEHMVQRDSAYESWSERVEESINGEHAGRRPIQLACSRQGCPCDHTYQRELKACARCQVVLYCSEACQAQDWERHKKHCKTLRKLKDDKPAITELARSVYYKDQADL